MGPPDLLLVCTVSFTVVFVVLGLLAAIMRALIQVFPERPATSTDAALIAAVTAAASAVFPGTEVTKIEEMK